MGHTPFGYQIKNGKAVIDKEAAEQIKTLYKSYLSGDSLMAAAKKAGIKSLHAGVGRLLQNAHYHGNEYYPAIIDPNTYEAVQEERINRAARLGRIREPKQDKEVVFPTSFYMNKESQHFDDPFQRAEYAYSLIEMEVGANGSQHECHSDSSKEA